MDASRPAARTILPGPTDADDGLHLLGIVRAGVRELPARWRRGRGGATQSIEYRDIAALVRAVPYRVPQMSREAVESHHRELDAVMQRGSVVPAPFGIVFRDRDGVLHFLGEQYPLLDRVLMVVEGRWEFRLHIRGMPVQDAPVGRDPSVRIYTELHQIASAAVPFRTADEGLFSAAFLVERTATRRFLGRIDELTDQHRSVSLDLTGPWPAYDFVIIAP